MKKILMCILVFVLVMLKCISAGAEINYDWAFDPRVGVYVVDKVNDEGRYSAYYCIGEEFMITLERDIWHGDGWISMIRDNGGYSRLYYECDWEGEVQSQKIIDELVRNALAILGAA